MEEIVEVLLNEKLAFIIKTPRQIKCVSSIKSLSAKHIKRYCVLLLSGLGMYSICLQFY